MFVPITLENFCRQYTRRLYGISLKNSDLPQCTLQANQARVKVHLTPMMIQYLLIDQINMSHIPRRRGAIDMMHLVINHLHTSSLHGDHLGAFMMSD